LQFAPNSTLKPLAPSDPGIEPGETALERLDLPQGAAAIRVNSPQLAVSILRPDRLWFRPQNTYIRQAQPFDKRVAIC
jgi:hypothetical protein